MTKGINFPVVVAKQVFTNKDGSTGTLFLVSSDTSLTYDQLTTLYQKRWNVEVVHKSLKQNAALERSPTKTIRSQSNHFALKSKLYIKALKDTYFDFVNFETA